MPSAILGSRRNSFGAKEFAGIFHACLGGLCLVDPGLAERAPPKLEKVGKGYANEHGRGKDARRESLPGFLRRKQTSCRGGCAVRLFKPQTKLRRKKNADGEDRYSISGALCKRALRELLWHFKTEKSYEYL